MLRMFLNLGTTGIRKTEKAGHLVEGFARGIIDRAADELIVAHRPGMNEHGVSPGDNESEVGGKSGLRDAGCWLLIFEKWREEVALHVIDGEEGFP